MCLDNIIKVYTPPLDGITAYKVMVSHGCGLYHGPYYSDGFFKIGDTIKGAYNHCIGVGAKPGWLVALDDTTYNVGYHVFKDLQDARDYCEAGDFNEVVVRVTAKGVHTHGMQEDKPVYVCEEVTLENTMPDLG